MKKMLLFILVPIVLLGSALATYLSGGRYITSENAYIRAGISMVSAGRSGRIDEVFVQENQKVKKGELLFNMDSEPFDLAIEQAAAKLAAIRLEVNILKANLQRQRVNVTSAGDEKTFAEAELARVKTLNHSSAMSEEKIAIKAHKLITANNNLSIVNADLKTAVVELGGDENMLIDDYPRVKEALGVYEKTLLDRRRAEVHAGISGSIVRLELHRDEYVREGQAIFSIVADDDLWVEANLKETQLTRLRIGQSAVFEIDAYPDESFAGHVTTIAPAAGSEFAILPPQNATGNWVKVTQRIPVRLTLDKSKAALRAGMSVTVKIDTEHKRGLKELFKKISPF